jgi:ankyrin repeat protein
MARVRTERLLGQALLVRDNATIDLLLDRGADVNATAIGEDTPLHWAVREKNADLVNKLLAKGANPNAPLADTPNSTGHPDYTTPLWYAIGNQDVAMMTLLLDKGADPNLLSRNDSTALDHVNENRFARGAAMKKLLLAHRAITAKELKAAGAAQNSTLRK